MSINRAVQTAYNNTTLAVTSALTVVPILGSHVCDCGYDLAAITNGFRVRKNGVYRFSFDVTFTATTAGTVTASLYLDETPLPCASSSETVGDNSLTTLHVETTIPVNACCVYRPVLTCRTSGLAGNVSHVCASAIKV